MIIKLRSPYPRQQPHSCPRIDFGFQEAIFLRPAKPMLIAFDRVLSRRRSTRQFGEKLPITKLGQLLWLAVKSRDLKPPPERPDWQSRPYPSAGGCHEIGLLVLNVAGHEDAAFIYDAGHHALGALSGVTGTQIHRFIAEVSEVIPAGSATILWFIADVRKLAARYAHHESLLWRDSGALAATLSLVAAALDCPICTVGIHAPSALQAMLSRDSSLAGVGGCLVGLPSGRKRSGR